MNAPSSVVLVAVARGILNASVVEAVVALARETLVACVSQAVGEVPETSNAFEVVAAAALEQVNELASACHHMELETSILPWHGD